MKLLLQAVQVPVKMHPLALCPTIRHHLSLLVMVRPSSDLVKGVEEGGGKVQHI